MLVYGIIVAALALLFTRIPTGFLPDEDQGVMFVEVKMPPGATRSQNRTGALRRSRLCPQRGEGQHQLDLRSPRIQLRRTRSERRDRLLHTQGLGRAAG